MEDLEALCKKLSFLSTKNQLKWNGSKNDLLRFLALHLEVQPNQFRANDNGTCAVFKIQNITCNFYHKAKTLQIQGKEDADKLRKDLINLTSTWAHPVSETLNAFQENLDNDVQAREVIATGLVSPSDDPITINADNSLGGDFAKPPVSPTEDDLAKAENFIDSAYMEVILDANKSPYSNLVKDIEADYDSQLTQLSLLLKKVSNELIDLKASHAALLAANNEITNELTALRNELTSGFITETYQYIQLIDQPTRITSSTRTLIDHIFTNKPNIITNHGVLHVGISDHSLIYATHKHNTLKADPKIIESRQFKNFDCDAFIEDIKETPFHFASLMDDPNEMWDVWKSLFLEVINKHAPMRKRKVKSKSSPWITAELRRKMRKRDF